MDDDMPTLVDMGSVVPFQSFSEGGHLPPATARTNHRRNLNSEYIPRPPNAFILFRSAFIQSQKISGSQVLGTTTNSSTLSKIIGGYWRALPKVEKDAWEEKARVATEEWRVRYPDWRFRTVSANGRTGGRGKGKAADNSGRASYKRKRPPARAKLKDKDSSGRRTRGSKRAMTGIARGKGRRVDVPVPKSLSPSPDPTAVSGFVHVTVSLDHATESTAPTRRSARLSKANLSATSSTSRQPPDHPKADHADEDAQSPAFDRKGKGKAKESSSRYESDEEDDGASGSGNIASDILNYELYDGEEQDGEYDLDVENEERVFSDPPDDDELEDNQLVSDDDSGSDFAPSPPLGTRSKGLKRRSADDVDDGSGTDGEGTVKLTRGRPVSWAKNGQIPSLRNDGNSPIPLSSRSSRSHKRTDSESQVPLTSMFKKQKTGKTGHRRSLSLPPLCSMEDADVPNPAPIQEPSYSSTSYDYSYDQQYWSPEKLESTLSWEGMEYQTLDIGPEPSMSLSPSGTEPPTSPISSPEEMASSTFSRSYSSFPYYSHPEGFQQRQEIGNPIQHISRSNTRHRTWSHVADPHSSSSLSTPYSSRSSVRRDTVSLPLHRDFQRGLNWRQVEEERRANLDETARVLSRPVSPTKSHHSQLTWGEVEEGRRHELDANMATLSTTEGMGYMTSEASQDEHDAFSRFHGGIAPSSSHVVPSSQQSHYSSPEVPCMTWQTNTDRPGLVTFVRDPNIYMNSADPHISRFSTLSGWSGDASSSKTASAVPVDQQSTTLLDSDCLPGHAIFGPDYSLQPVGLCGGSGAEPGSSLRSLNYLG
ncbi:hypothetical protein C8J56DRAFT_1041298 [Mycena floridula]|nr:hypothetical protein C8J56DRAFT_1041298 [Mycena floridula]